MNALAQHIVSWLKDYADQSNTNGWVVGVSGGIDSAVTSTLCAHTGLSTCVVEMPIHQHPDQVGRAQTHVGGLAAEFPNVSKARVDLTEVYEGLVTALPESDDASGGLALANSRARLRMTTLYALAAQRGALVAGTGNKVEDFGVGFYTKYGDGGVDLSPIADLVKTEVFALGAALGVDERDRGAAAARARFVVDRPGAGCDHRLQRERTVVDAIPDVVQPLAATFEELGDR